jgi:pyrroloquinoline quinone biosynthesis protein B
VRPRSQSSVAVSADGDWWFLLNASADVRSQIGASNYLWPPVGNHRGTSIAGCVLTDAEIDHTSGLLQLREGCRFGVFSTPIVKRWLHQNLPIGSILADFADRPWSELALDEWSVLPLPDGTPSGLRVRSFEVGRDVPRFVPELPDESVGSVIGLQIEDSHGAKLVYAPGVATICDGLRSACEDAGCILIDGTFWSDDEPTRAKIKDSTATQMGHVPVSGQQGTLSWLSGLSVEHRVYVHINNTNPMLNERGSQHAEVVRCGVRVGMDGDVIDI